jgi:hypothetical protein
MLNICSPFSGIFPCNASLLLLLSNRSGDLVLKSISEFLGVHLVPNLSSRFVTVGVRSDCGLSAMSPQSTVVAGLQGTFYPSACCW